LWQAEQKFSALGPPFASIADIDNDGYIAGGPVWAQNSPFKIRQRLDFGARAGICTVAGGNCLFIDPVARLGNDLRTHSQARLKVTSLIALSDSIRVCSSNPAQDYNTTKHSGSHVRDLPSE